MSKFRDASDDSITDIPDALRELVESAGKTAAIPHFYFNGIIISQGTADVTLILQLNNQPVVALNCSFTIAKTLSNALAKGIKELELIAGRDIMTVDDIVKSIQKAADQSDVANKSK